MRPRHRLVRHDDAGTHDRERGQVAGIEVLPFGFLVLVAGMLLVVNAWAVVDAKLAVTVAAREAARAYVEAPDAPTAHAAARRRAVEAMQAHGRADATRLVVTVSAPHGHGRCRPVVVTVSYTTPALVVPFTGGFGRSLTATSTHTELVDPYRDGLPESRCIT
jgi:Flp pilus assembly protein TadG